MLASALSINPNLTIYSIVPPEAQQGWKLELFELSEPIAAHYHKVQRQILLVVGGELKARYGKDEEKTLHQSDLLTIDPGTVHSLIPKEKASFFALDLPGFQFPEDVFQGYPSEAFFWEAPYADFLPPLDGKYFRNRIDAGKYAAYELINGSKTENRWSAALLEIDDSPKHYHKIEREVFIVVNGKLNIEIEGKRGVLSAGESVAILPGMVHKLKSACERPARTLCFNFPAFNPEDMHCLEE